jgi:hypothetical protein
VAESFQDGRQDVVLPGDRARADLAVQIQVAQDGLVPGAPEISMAGLQA